MERPPFMLPSAGLVGEFYQLVLAATYHADGLWGEATFDLYPRALPEGWGYLVAAGLEPVLTMLESLRFDEGEVAALRAQPVFGKVPASFFDALLRLRFEGDVHAVAEGTPVFPNEPVLRITAPLWVATLLETRLVQLVGTSTAVATRASRLCDAAAGRAILDFGARRSAGGESALLASRAAWLGGASATSNAQATLAYGIPPHGTMSDTFLAAYGEDALAYAAFRLHFPWLGHYALPDDDAAHGLDRFAAFKEQVSVVRVDHDDLLPHARRVRAGLDARGMKSCRILGSGQLDAPKIAALVAADAPIAMFAVGRSLAAASEPGMKLVFRVAELARGNRRAPATREGSAAYPGRKQVIRFESHDLLCLDAEAGAWSRAGWPLLRPVMMRGRRLEPGEALAASRDRRSVMVTALPAALRGVPATGVREVRISDGVAALALG